MELTPAFKTIPTLELVHYWKKKSINGRILSIDSIILIRSAFACLVYLKSHSNFLFFLLSLINGGDNSGHRFGSSGGVNSGGSKAYELALELGWERIRNKVPITVPELESHHP